MKDVNPYAEIAMAADPLSFAVGSGYYRWIKNN